MSTVRDAGLLKRTPRYYILTFTVLALTMGAAWVGFAFLQDTWYTLIIAGVLGVLFTQFSFLTHELAHRTVFTSGKVNDFTGRIMADLVVGISYSWWMTKHTRHHANPNTVGKDPDIDTDFIVFQPEIAQAMTGVRGWFVRHQGWFFYPALLLEGINLHVHAFRTVFSPGKVDKRALEIVLLLVRNIGYVAVVFAFLPLGMAFAFLGVQLAIFGFYMGSSFAPNHIGMPQLPKDSRVDFLRRQVLTSRNIKSGAFMNHFMGGLNYQIEHHLFPSMPRPHLARTREIVMEYCSTRDIKYLEVSLGEAHRQVLSFVSRVGLSGRGNPFECPAAFRYGR